nr:MAG TPA: hypothetical protein [Bacteriophage sp.]
MIHIGACLLCAQCSRADRRERQRATNEGQKCSILPKEKKVLIERKFLQKGLTFALNEHIIKTVKDTNTQQHGGTKL